ncbi:CGNR zinc finger domain-containing protein [Nonomuraea jiangxiensis]|uniref:CGNR zinc finger domain-containing protein n=2 Tax=Nonomuraea jiangxiensis TaxID=633440 RepID=A0A1G9N6J6_9ACTN|nr:CGNR zinc finger domain-containing protein [Nonomuraea jiangxiensis]
MSRMVEFVNEYADRPRATAGEQELPYPDAAKVLGWPAEPPLPAAADLVAAANAAFRVFSAARDGRAYEELNTLLRSVRPLPVATESGLRWTVDTQAEVLPAALGTCLLEWLMHHGRPRLGTCHASKCADVYVDTSPAGQRRFCSSTCLNRHKVAAYRRRSSQDRTGEPETTT